MKIQPVPWLLMIAAGLHAVPAAAVVPDAQARVEQALHARLSLAYPSVTRWEIEAMPAVRRAARTMTATGPQVQQIVITRIGARSAVW
ncbi:MAG TPA: hypothetical protein VNZ06_13650, partial [Steroidobacteraceae bacterium]|nr:hypothetical protein [Steroidobacteraceae bacterium]